MIYLSHSAPRLDGSVEWFIVGVAGEQTLDQEIASLKEYRRRVILVDTATLRIEEV